MEKYAVDIDKVLDDFEETEALKIDNSHKNANSSILQSPLYINYNEQIQPNVNDVGHIYQNVFKLNEDDANSNEKNASSSDKDSVLQHLAEEECPKHLERPDGCDPKNNSFIENGVEVSARSYAPEQCCVSSQPSSLSISEIQNGINSSHDSCYSLNTKSSDGNEKCQFVSDSDSVNAVKSVLESVSESHPVKESNLLLPFNSSCDKNEYFQNSHKSYLDNTIGPETNIANAFQELEGIEWDLSVMNLKESCTDENEVTEEIVTQFSNDALSSAVSDVNEGNCDSDSETHKPPSFVEKSAVISKLEATASEVSEQCSQNDSSKSTSNSVVQDNEEHQMCDQVVLPRDVNAEPEYVSEDDDSGVSSEERNNSPLFYFNNQELNCNDDADVEANQEVSLSENFDRSCDNKEDSESRMPSSISNLNGKSDKDLTKCSENISELQTVEGYLLSESAFNSSSSNKFTGARPKLDGQISQNPVPDDCNEETDVQITNKDSKDDYTNNSDKVIQHCETEVISEASEATNFEISESSDAVPVYTSSNTKPETLNIVKSTDSECDSEISDIKKSISADTNKESSVTSHLKNGNFQQRLSRPTTLDLPSRHLSASHCIGENNVNVTGNSNLESSPATDFLSSENSVDDSASESLPKQQPKIGLVKPFWIPDADAPNCMHCGVKFTVIKRRHHCRACGKVLCSRCCNLKAKLAYLNKEDRICHPCFDILSSTSQTEDLTSTAADSQSISSCGSSPNFSPSPQIPNSNFDDKNSWRPHPNNPDDYCSTIPPLQQIQQSGARPPPTVMVPIGVLKRGNKPRKEPKQVIFSDGIRPGGDLTDLTEPADAIPVYRRIGRKRVEKALSGESINTVGSPSVSSQRSRQKRILVSDDEGPLPPVILHYDNDPPKDEKVDWNQLLQKMQDDDQKPVNFALMKNMHLFVKLTKLDCCFGKECWCFTSHGLCAVAQDEIMVILERLPGECTLPRGIIKLLTHIYDSASKGSTLDDLSHIIFPEQILGSSDHRGFLFVRPTFQCLSKLVVPNTPFLVAILIHKWEVPWAKVFPLRLMLRLGAECRYYPCALVSVRHRKPVFFEIGQTIMSVLADLRNYQFTIPVIPGLVVHMEEKKTSVNIPRNRYEKVMKVLNSNNVEHVLALGSNFSSEADSHLVCMQKEEGDYQTQAINIENTTRRELDTLGQLAILPSLITAEGKVDSDLFSLIIDVLAWKVTGASFIVFSGALKSSSGLSAKFSIVEDGLLVQIPQETMVALHMALRDMKDLTIECGQINAAEPEEVVIIQWTRDDKKFNLGVRSPIDYRSLEGVPSLRIHTSTDYAGDNYLIRWTEVFFLEVDESSSSCTIQHELVDPCRLAETIAQSCCMALTPYLDQLAESELTKIGLRVTLDSERDRVEYDIGARGKPLPAAYMNALDCGLIPVILRLSSSAQSEPVSFELIFYILIK